jgi:hypothetical protein
MRQTDFTKDWRGTPIEVGQTVIYGSGVGSHSIQLNEATIEELPNENGRVKVRLVRRSYSQGTKPVVDVGHDRITIVTELPPSELQTQPEHAAESAERMRRYKTHLKPQYPYYDYSLRGEAKLQADRKYNEEMEFYRAHPCLKCNVSSQDLFKVECDVVN